MTDAPSLALPAALLVDQDGTLVDSEPVWESAERGLTESLGGILTAEMRRSMVGAPLSVTIDAILSASGADVSPEALGATLVERVAHLLEDAPVPWIRPVVELVDRCRRAGTRVGLVTSSYRRIAEVVAPRIPGGVDVVVAGDDVTHPKPAPDAYLEAARRLGVTPQACLVLEDSPSGVEAGLASGARVVAIPNQLRIPPRPGLSRVCSARELDATVLARIMSGEDVDTVPAAWEPALR